MKAVLGILGIAVGFIVLSVIISQTSHPGKQLDPNPQATATKKWEADQEKEKAALAASEKKNAEKITGTDPKTTPSAPAVTGMVVATLEVKGKGPITLELNATAAPKTVSHMVKLIKDGFYNGIYFHRVVPGFVAQVGDPKSKSYKQEELLGKSESELGSLGLGQGGSGEAIEFEANDLNNDIGTLAMALNSPRSATGDSQFFINLVANHSLDRDYCVFGKVTAGMDVVNKLVNGDQIASIKVK